MVPDPSAPKSPCTWPRLTTRGYVAGSTTKPECCAPPILNRTYDTGTIVLSAFSECSRATRPLPRGIPPFVFAFDHVTGMESTCDVGRGRRARMT